MKTIAKVASFLLIAVAAGCASVDVSTEGGSGPSQGQIELEQMLAASSQGK